jgi:nucleotide-binding universal stress UspA family protein
MKECDKIIVPTDLSENSRRAVEFAAELAIDEKAALVVLHVANEFAAWELYDDAFGYSAHWPLDRVLAEAALELSRYLEPQRKLLKDLPTVTKRLVLGLVPDQIISVAEEEGADLIVLSPRHQRGLMRLLSIGTTEKVTRRSPCPVLLVPPAPHHKRWHGKVSPRQGRSNRDSKARYGESSAPHFAQYFESA